MQCPRRVIPASGSAVRLFFLPPAEREVRVVACLPLVGPAARQGYLGPALAGLGGAGKLLLGEVAAVGPPAAAVVAEVRAGAEGSRVEFARDPGDQAGVHRGGGPLGHGTGGGRCLVRHRLTGTGLRTGFRLRFSGGGGTAEA